MSKVNLSQQAEKLKSLVGSARLQTSSPSTVTNEETREVKPEASEQRTPTSPRIEPARTKAKNLKAIPVSYFDAHAELKATSKTSLDFSSYIIEAIREKLERDGALGQ